MADDDDDDFQNPSDCAFLPLSQPTSTRSPPPSLKLSSKSRPPLKPSNSQTLLRPSKRFKRSPNPGKENLSLPSPPSLPPFHRLQNNWALDEPSPSSSLSWNLPVDSDADRVCSSIAEESGAASVRASLDDECGGKLDKDESCGHFGVRVSSSNFSIESRLLGSRLDRQPTSSGDGDSADDESEDFEPGTQLDMLLDLCCNGSQQDVPTGMEFGCPDEHNSSGMVVVHCPLCGVDISDLNDEQRQVHTNDCLDKEESPNVVVPPVDRGQVVDGTSAQSSGQVVDAFPVVEWLRGLGLGKYDEIFTREEIDWDTLKWLTEEDLFSIGVTALGPRKKIAHALEEFRRGSSHTVDTVDTSEVKVDGTSKVAANKLITDFFAGPVANRNNCNATPNIKCGKKNYSCSGRKQAANPIKKGKLRDIPVWCCVPGTPFRVDAFRFLRRDCSHWFLTHFHLDHYQGLTRSFCHGMIYCSLITARLVNMKLGIPWEKLHVLPLNQKITVAGVDMTCMDANHCPGSIIILFEPPDGKAVLHTGDFRFSEGMAGIPALRNHPIHTLILDTTYCNPQFDFPKQEAVIQFVIEAIQAEAFNPKTLFLIGSYTIGKERLFLEVGRVLRQKVYVTLAKMRLLQCLELPDEDMKWLTLNEHESHIHVVPMWTLASFKRLKHTANQYANRFSLIVAFSPTGWTFGKGKKKSPGRRWQQGTIIRYEVPYSEHCSFTELKEFVKVISPARIIPSVNNDGPESSNAMVDLLS